jgi:hypothetical protein
MPDIPNAAEPTRSSDRLPRFIKFLPAILLLIFILTFGGVLTALEFWYKSLESQIERAHASLREQGLPVTLKDLDAWYTAVPKSENGALIYQEAFASLEQLDPNAERLESLYKRTDSMGRIADFPSEHADAVRRYVAEAAPVLELLDEAATYPRYRFPMDLSLLPWVEMPHLAKLRDLLRLRHIATEASVMQGDTQGAVEHHVGALAIQASLVNEPVFISQMLRVTSTQRSCAALERLLVHAQLDERQLAMLDSAYAAVAHPESVRRIFVADYCLVSSVTRAAYDGSLRPPDEDIRKIVAKLQAHSWPLRDFESLLDECYVHNAFLSNIPDPEPEWSALLRKARSLDRPKFRTWSALDSRSPNLYMSVRSVATEAGFLAAARAAIAVERYQVVHGALPPVLDDCVPNFLASLPEDLYDGTPIRYSRQENGYIVYSIGEDLVDNGGLKVQRDKSGNRVQNESGDYLGDFSLVVQR